MLVGKLYVMWCDARVRSREAISRFLREERGDAIQNVMILAIAAVLLVALLGFGKTGIKIIEEYWKNAQ